MNDTAKTSFALSKTVDYSEAVVLMCASIIEKRGTTTVKSLCHALNSQFLIEDSDIKDALRVLKNPVGFQALRMWRGRSKTDATFVKVVRTPQYDDWARSLLESKPYLKPLTTIS